MTKCLKSCSYLSAHWGPHYHGHKEPLSWTWGGHHTPRTGPGDAGKIGPGFEEKVRPHLFWAGSCNQILGSLEMEFKNHIYLTLNKLYHRQHFYQ